MESYGSNQDNYYNNDDDDEIDIYDEIIAYDIDELINLYENSYAWASLLNNIRALGSLYSKYGIEALTFPDFIYQYYQSNKMKLCSSRYGDVSRYQCLIQAIIHHDNYTFDIIVPMINIHEEVNSAIRTSIEYRYLHGIEVLLTTKRRTNIVYIEEAIFTGDDEIIQTVINSDVQVGIYYNANYINEISKHNPHLMKFFLEHPHYARLEHIDPISPRTQSRLRNLFNRRPSFSSKYLNSSNGSTSPRTSPKVSPTDSPNKELSKSKILFSTSR